MSLIYGYDDHALDNTNAALKGAYDAYSALQVAFDTIQDSYKALSNVKRCTGSNNIQTFTASMEFNQYNERKIVKAFKNGIVLLGIVTISSKDYPHTGMVYYDFCDPTGKIQMEEIRSRHGDYVILNEDSDDKILNIQDVYTAPKPCSITIKLAAKNNNLNAKPSKPVKLNITLQYIEFPPHDYGSEAKQASDLKDSNNMITK